MIDILSVGCALAVVLALAYAAVWLLRRLQPRGGSGPEVQFLRATAVGPKERVVAVRWRDEILLLGVTSSAITVIDRTPGPSAIAATPVPAHGRCLARDLAATTTHPAHRKTRRVIERDGLSATPPLAQADTPGG